MINKSIKQDLVAGFSVFLLALPLCLGIAMASHFPPSAGLISAIIGGMLASFFGGAKLSIKGPAAGLIVIALGAVLELGQGDFQLGYERALAVGVVAALLQIGIALGRKAIIAEIMPPSVIHGMLAAIGVIIVAKQFYVMIGLHPMSTSIFELIYDMPAAFLNANPLIFMIGILALVITIVWPRIKQFNWVPSSMVVILLVIPLSLYFGIAKEHAYSFMGSQYSLSEHLLVKLPNNFVEAIQFPDFSYLLTFASIKYIIMFTLVGSIESLLTVVAIDSIKLQKKGSDLNKDLLAVGVGNLCSALLGGLPMISEIVRSKANIEYGAQSEKANFFHGTFMLISVIALVPLINLIPLSALAALLVYIGIKLASPREFYHVYKIGLDQLIIFMTTLIVTLVEDLLIGVLTGIAVKVVLHLIRGNNPYRLLKPTLITKSQDHDLVIKVDGPLTFMSYLRLKRTIFSCDVQKYKVILDLTGTTFIDHTVILKLESLKSEFGQDHIIIKGQEGLLPLYGHTQSSRKQARL